MATKIEKLTDQIISKLGSDWYAVGQGLRRVQDHKLYAQLNYDNMGEYIDAEFGNELGYRKAMSLIRMVRDQERLGYTAGQVRSLIKDHNVSTAWIALRNARDGMTYKKLYARCALPNTHLTADLKKDGKLVFNATISVDNHVLLMDLLKKHGLKDSPSGKARGAGEAFDAFLTRYFSKKGK